MHQQKLAKGINTYNVRSRRRCIPARILRSKTVKKATDNNNGNIIGKNFNQSTSINHTRFIKIIFVIIKLIFILITFYNIFRSTNR
jgi:hypothetical protein